MLRQRYLSTQIKSLRHLNYGLNVTANQWLNNQEGCFVSQAEWSI